MWTSANRNRFAWTLLGLFCATVVLLSCRQPGATARKEAMQTPHVMPSFNIGGYMFRYPAAPSMDDTKNRDPEKDVAQVNATCLSCHTQSDGDTMHNGKLSNGNAQAVKNITCVDCRAATKSPAFPPT